MAKDPAVLFYTSDFLSGTITMTMEQKGKYITLLCIQHQQGFLTDEDLETILTDKDKRVKEKFVKQADGNYINIKLKVESDRRKAYTESRRNNRVKDKSNLSVTYDKLMETGTGTEAETRTENKTLTKTITETKTSNSSFNKQDIAEDTLFDFFNNIDEIPKPVFNKPNLPSKEELDSLDEIFSK